MSGVDELRAAREALARYREQSICGTCRDDADAVIDLLDKDIEFEGLMRQYVAAGMRHPRATQVPERSRQIGEASAEVRRRLGLADRRPDALGVVRSWREDLGGMIPRPLGLLSGPAKRKT